jgi:DNA polymerase-3 subunit gamma/tau
MGKALYREHRPLTLSDVKGQSHITDTLEHAIAKGAISHAYLFTGPRGVGKTSVARILAHRINNLEYTENETHLDIIEIDAASNRRIDEIRDLRDKVHIAPTSSKYKVYIIDEVHMLTREAFNALLKTLEEPPEHAVFILATTEAHKVPDTIISRSQQFSFKPVTIPEAVAHLREIADKEKMSIDDGALQLIAHHGNGSFRDSISMLDQLTGFDLETITATDVARLLGVPNSDTLQKILATLAANDVTRLFDTVQTLRETGTNPSKIAQSLVSLLRTRLAMNNELPYNWSVRLMKDLLPLTAGNATFETLEITLLGAIFIDDQPKQAIHSVRKVQKTNDELKHESTPVPEKVKLTDPIKEVVPPIIVTSSTEKIVENTPKQPVVKTVSDAAVETKPQETVETESEAWVNVLNQIKSSHNTLYGVLRMAEVSTEENSVTLTFRFEFHKKQFAQGTNMKILHDIVTNVYGSPHKIHMNVNKTTKKPATRRKNVDTDARLTNISNIFGGAELLD